MSITWDPERMSTGIAEIDTQHRELIRRFNEFDAAVAQRHGRDSLLRTLEFLAQYADMHFRHEEDCMNRYQCPAAATNAMAHEKMRAEVGRLLDHVRNEGATSIDVIDLETTLGAWVRQHICQIDVRLRECVNAGACHTSGGTARS